MGNYAEFEEKEYEFPLCRELAEGSQFIWSPGQVLEKLLGFDNAQFTQNMTFWKMVGRSSFPFQGGVILRTIDTDPSIVRSLPTFKCNLMVQVKRPQYLKRRSSGYNGKIPYYRFKIEKEQQQVLQNLKAKVGNQAYICYASPAFHQFFDLQLHSLHSELVAYSNYVEVGCLANHKHWAYCNPGTVGKACSEPEDVDGIPFAEKLQELASVEREWKLENESHNDINLRMEALRNLAVEIHEACFEIGRPDDSFHRKLNGLRNMDTSGENDTLRTVHYFSTIQVFCSVFDLSWFVIG